MTFKFYTRQKFESERDHDEEGWYITVWCTDCRATQRVDHEGYQSEWEMSHVCPNEEDGDDE